VVFFWGGFATFYRKLSPANASFRRLTITLSTRVNAQNRNRRRSDFRRPPHPSDVLCVVSSRARIRPPEHSSAFAELEHDGHTMGRTRDPERSSDREYHPESRNSILCVCVCNRPSIRVCPAAVQGVLHDEPGPAAVLVEHDGRRQQSADHHQRTHAPVHIHHTGASVHERRARAIVVARPGQNATRRYGRCVFVGHGGVRDNHRCSVPSICLAIHS